MNGYLVISDQKIKHTETNERNDWCYFSVVLIVVVIPRQKENNK